MTTDLEQKIQELRDQVDKSLIKRQDIFIKKNKAKENLESIILLIDNCIESKKDIYKNIFKCCYYSNILGEKIVPNNNVYWRFILNELDYFCDIDVSINPHDEPWLFTKRLFVKDVSKPKYFFYIIKDDNWRFAKVAYKSVYYRCGFNSEEKQRAFDAIDMREIKWIDSIEDLVDSILVEVIENIQEQLKK